MQVRTSGSHPLEIAAVQPRAGLGRIGITFCPGKIQRGGMTGPWERDLSVDLDAVRIWGAAVIVTLLEAHEIAELSVASLGYEARVRGLEWLHLPIRDISTPSAHFEQKWVEAGESLRARLRDGFDIVVHCKGGLGRAGTIAARLLVELGTSPKVAIQQVRDARPGAIETSAQQAHVESITSIPEPQPGRSLEAMDDKAIGALLGLAVGEAVGTTLEFKSRDSYAPLTGMVGGGPFALKPGEWTDDTAMALSLADTLLDDAGFDEAALMRRFVAWRDRGDYSCTGTCFDIGLTVSGALQRWQQTGNPVAGATDPMSAGNGSLMRLAPVAISHWSDRDSLCSLARRQSATTHGAPEAVDACVAFANVLADAIEGKPRSEVMRSRATNYAGKIRPIMSGSWRGKRRNEIESSGYVAHSLEAALWAVGRTATFRDAVLLAANLGGDADTTAAITGQLAGTLYGATGIPAEWLEKLSWRTKIEKTARSLYARSLADTRIAGR